MDAFRDVVIKAARFSVVLTNPKVITEEIMILCFRKQRELKEFQGAKKRYHLDTIQF